MSEITLEYVESLVVKLPPQDQMALIRRLGDILKTKEIPPQQDKRLRSLRGIWQGKVPQDFNVEAALQEIRQEWTKELEEFGS